MTSKTQPKTLGSRAMSHLRTPPPLHIPKMPFNAAHPPPQQIYPPHKPTHSNSSFSTTSSSKSYSSYSTYYTHPTLHPTGTFPAPRTEYMRQLLELDSIPTSHNILAGLSTWLLLAGFIIFPGTFSTLSSSHHSGTTETLISSISSIPLLVLASISSGIGILGMLWVFWCHRANYVWLCNRVFMPGVMNSAVGLLGTLVGVYGSREGVWGKTAKITGGVTGGGLVVCGALYGVYYFVLLRGVRRVHERDGGEGVGLGIGEKGRGVMV